MAEEKTRKPEQLNEEQLQEEQLDEVNGGGRYTVSGNTIIRLP